MASEERVKSRFAGKDAHLKVSQDFFEETMYWLRKTLGGRLFAVGNRVGEAIAQKLYYNRRIQRNKEGFEKCVEEFQDAGLGRFEVSKVSFEECRARIVCRNSTEASAVLKEDGQVSDAVCDYSRGILVSFMRFTSVKSACACVETKCVAKGDEYCEFVMGEEKSGVDEWLKSF